MYCLQTCPCIFQPGNVTDLDSEGVNISEATETTAGSLRSAEPRPNARQYASMARWLIVGWLVLTVVKLPKAIRLLPTKRNAGATGAILAHLDLRPS